MVNRRCPISGNCGCVVINNCCATILPPINQVNKPVNTARQSHCHVKQLKSPVIDNGSATLMFGYLVMIALNIFGTLNDDKHVPKDNYLPKLNQSVAKNPATFLFAFETTP